MLREDCLVWGPNTGLGRTVCVECLCDFQVRCSDHCNDTLTCLCRVTAAVLSVGVPCAPPTSPLTRYTTRNASCSGASR